ncbi:MAG TPA: restriction endonuclease [Candidatus Ornithoclostridium faecavium]|nr:restriction endonuclease [Candidatus Ornithoclostridium faecavium]
MTKTELFIQLAQPDANGMSRWVSASEFVGQYADLKFGNGASWARKESTLAKKYIIEFDKSITPGNGIDRIRLNGFNDGDYSQHIRADIKRAIKARRCVVLGTSNPEVDHKNGMKNEARVMRNEDQRLEDFQPLSKAANDAKRQYCKECMRTGIRYDAKKLGYPMSYYKGAATHHNEENACEGCYWYDPIEFKNHLQEKK